METESALDVVDGEVLFLGCVGDGLAVSEVVLEFLGVVGSAFPGISVTFPVSLGCVSEAVNIASLEAEGDSGTGFSGVTTGG